MANVAPIIVIVGPTASGKTSLAIKIAKKYNGEIISADSRTVYKGMDIGTAKPTLKEQEGVKHHLIDVVKPDDKFTVADFKTMALDCIDRVNSRGKIAILVGGTGLYVDSVIYDYQFGKKSDQNFRDKLNLLSVQQLQDEISARHIPMPENLNNKRYLIRAIELGGSTQKKNVVRNNTLMIGLDVNREELRERVTKRANSMLSLGVIEEATRLSQEYGWEAEPMKSNIYRVLKDYLEGRSDIESTKQKIIQSDMRLAKKQMTWFKRNKNIQWGNAKQLMKLVDDFVKNIN